MTAITSPAPALEWQHVSLDLGEFALRDVSLRVDDGAWIAIVGATGAGKTLLLETAAGFLRPTSGRVVRGGIDVSGEPPERRGVAYAPQDDLLFPHLDVRRNLTFGAIACGGDVGRVAELAAHLGIAHLLDRRVAHISGGEAQRVALGRALLSGASLLLLDECTSALDEVTRAHIGEVLARERGERRLSIVQVTHDLTEAHRLADAVVEMERGHLREGVHHASSIRAHHAPGGARRVSG